MSLTQGKKTEVLVKGAYKELYKEYPASVQDFDGNPPSEDNNYLYIAFLDVFHGQVVTKEGYEMVFSIVKKDDSWEAEFIPKIVDS